MGYFGVVGGDRRQLYAARSLEKRGWNVLLAGWEQGEGTEGLHQVSLEEVGRQCENVLLPLPVTRDGLMLHAPFSQAPIPLGDGFARLLSGVVCLWVWRKNCRPPRPCGSRSLCWTTPPGKKWPWETLFSQQRGPSRWRWRKPRVGSGVPGVW